MKIPRDINGSVLVKALQKLGYQMEYQKGSHIRMSQGNHAVAIPNHKPIKVGTLTKILKDVASRLNISIHEVINKL